MGPRHVNRVDGRWLQPEPLLMLGIPQVTLRDPRTLAAYRYARNAPSSYADSSGLLPMRMGGGVTRAERQQLQPAWKDLKDPGGNIRIQPMSKAGGHDALRGGVLRSGARALVRSETGRSQLLATHSALVRGEQHLTIMAVSDPQEVGATNVVYDNGWASPVSVQDQASGVAKTVRFNDCGPMGADSAVIIDAEALNMKPKNIAAVLVNELVHVEDEANGPASEGYAGDRSEQVEAKVRQELGAAPRGTDGALR
jgi:hypothetical protein